MESNIRRGLFWAALLHGLAYCLLLPAWMGEDEPWHVEYASYVVDGHGPFGVESVSKEKWEADLAVATYRQVQIQRRFPSISAEAIEGRQAQIVSSMARENFSGRVDWAPPLEGAVEFDSLAPNFSAIHQPPLYYFLLGNLGRGLGLDTPREILFAGRALSLVAFVIVAMLILGIGQRVFPSDRATVLAVLFAILLPMHARHSSVVNNDVLAKVLCAGVLFASLYATGYSWRRVGAVLVLSALALAAKPTAAAVAGVAVLFAVYSAWGSPLASKQKTLTRALRIGLPLLVVASSAALYLGSLDHGPVVSNTWHNFADRLQGSFSPKFLLELLGTSVGRFNWQSRPISPALVGLLGAGIGVLGVVIGKRLLGATSEPGRGSRFLLRVCLLFSLAQLALVVLRGVPIGRYLAPALPAIAILVGSLAWGEERGHSSSRWVIGIFLVLVAFSSYFLWGGLVFNQYVVLGA